MQSQTCLALIIFRTLARACFTLVICGYLETWSILPNRIFNLLFVATVSFSNNFNSSQWLRKITWLIQTSAETNSQQLREQFIQLIEKKFRFSHGDTPANGPALGDYNFRRKSYFATLLRGPAAEWFETSITDANTLAEIKEEFITRFADGQI